MTASNVNMITSFRVQTDSDDILYNEEDCRDQDVAAMIQNSVENHGQNCIVTAFHDTGDGPTDYETLWTLPGHEAVEAVRDWMWETSE